MGFDRAFMQMVDKRWSDAAHGSRCECGEDKAMGKKA